MGKGQPRNVGHLFHAFVEGLLLCECGGNSKTGRVISLLLTTKSLFHSILLGCAGNGCADGGGVLLFHSV